MRLPTTLSDYPRVLLVDDNAAMLESAAEVLSKTFEIVGAVSDGWEALEAARRLHPDVIVLDITMPGICGLEVATRLRDAGSTAAIVFLTIHDEQEVVQAARAAGGVGYVLKPRLASELPRATAEASAGRRFISADIADLAW